MQGLLGDSGAGGVPDVGSEGGDDADGAAHTLFQMVAVRGDANDASGCQGVDGGGEVGGGSPRSASIALAALDPAHHSNLDCRFNPWLIEGGGAL
ncbi:hypothetical protein ACQPXH_16970 [Nocardia sp. CA-135953]|uniref:hypothetical protein n=1 Tax=Nocardia sp. CA-135953 TaxID=3239978 RepID=UPI003D951DB2